MTDPGSFAAIAVALYAGHHVGDYWVQTDQQARHKGDSGRNGVGHCLMHVASYCMTQWAAVVILMLTLDIGITLWGALAGVFVSGLTHYLADRREHGIMFKIARKLPGKANFLRLGVPREPVVVESWLDCASCQGRGVGSVADESTGGKCWDCRGEGRLPSALTISDNPSLGTGAWALDQSWHIFWGVFVAGLVMVTF